MDSCAIFTVVHRVCCHPQGTHPCTHFCVVYGYEEVPITICGQVVMELHTHGNASLCDNRRPQILSSIISKHRQVRCCVLYGGTVGVLQWYVPAGSCILGGLKLHISPQSCVVEVFMHLLAVLHYCDLIVIAAWIRCLIRNGNRYVLSQIVLSGKRQTRQRIYEFPYAAL